MEAHGVPVTPDVKAAGTSSESALNVGAWFERGWSGAAGVGEKGMDMVSSFLDRFREAEALGYDNEGDQSEN